MLAITGATGFVGSRVLALAATPFHALTRREKPQTHWITGDLANSRALDQLCAGASAVIHIAGIVNAANRAAFDLGNVRGTANVIAAAQRAGVRRFIHVSSLSARAPALSDYGASKADADAEVMASGLDWTIVRPPGVYGPADREMLGVFKAARYGLSLAPASAEGRISLIHVDDLARALLALAAAQTCHQEILEIDDGQGDAGGYTHQAFAAQIGQAFGKRVQTLTVPPALLNSAARAATLAARLRGTLPTLSQDRARYLAHPDWVARGGNARLKGLWAPQIPLEAGIADTIAGYRKKGWL
jgi:nucleoside-diphosphate-sugar epimerase